MIYNIQGVVGGLGSRAQRSGPPCSCDIFRWDEKMNRWEMVGASDVAGYCTVGGTVRMTPELEKYCFGAN